MAISAKDENLANQHVAAWIEAMSKHNTPRPSEMVAANEAAMSEEGIRVLKERVAIEDGLSKYRQKLNKDVRMPTPDLTLSGDNQLVDSHVKAFAKVRPIIFLADPSMEVEIRTNASSPNGLAVLKQLQAIEHALTDEQLMNDVLKKFLVPKSHIGSSKPDNVR